MPRKKTTRAKAPKTGKYQVLAPRIDFGKPLGLIEPKGQVVVVELDEEFAEPLVGNGWIKKTTAKVNYTPTGPTAEPEEPETPDPEDPEEPEDKDASEKDDDGGDAKK